MRLPLTVFIIHAFTVFINHAFTVDCVHYPCVHCSLCSLTMRSPLTVVINHAFTVFKTLTMRSPFTVFVNHAFTVHCVLQPCVHRSIIKEYFSNFIHVYRRCRIECIPESCVQYILLKILCLSETLLAPTVISFGNAWCQYNNNSSLAVISCCNTSCLKYSSPTVISFGNAWCQHNINSSPTVISCCNTSCLKYSSPAVISFCNTCYQ
jgi:hypothetical protein